MIGPSILDDLRGSIAQRDAAIKQIVQSPIKSAIMGYVRSKGGNTEEAETIWHDVVVGLVKRAIKDRSFVVDELGPYMMGMAKYQCYDMLKARQAATKVSALDEEQIAELADDSYDAATLVLRGERGALLRSVLDQMRSRCKEVLLYWAGGYKMSEIAELLGYKSDMMARKKKSECLKQLYTYLADRPALTMQLRQL